MHTCKVHSASGSEMCVRALHSRIPSTISPTDAIPQFMCARLSLFSISFLGYFVLEYRSAVCFGPPQHNPTDHIIERWERERMEDRKMGKKSKMDENRSVGCFDDSFFHLTHSVRGRYGNLTFSSEKKRRDLPNACRRSPSQSRRWTICEKLFLFSAFTSANGFQLLLLFFLGK